MEPRTHARGNLLAIRPYPISFGGFNGATHSRAWKQARLRSIHRATYCFNGGTHSRAWKLSRPANSPPRSSLLQWSHALTRVETADSQKPAEAGTVASMEPRTHARGNRILGYSDTFSSNASMEPRTHARGNSTG